jgi:hypothetical protein
VRISFALEAGSQKPEFHRFLLCGFKAHSFKQFREVVVSLADSEPANILVLAPDLGYGQTDLLMNTAEEVSRLLNAYERVILASGFRIPLFVSGISRAKPWLIIVNHQQF